MQANEQLLTPTLPLQTQNYAGGLLRPKQKTELPYPYETQE